MRLRIALLSSFFLLNLVLSYFSFAGIIEGTESVVSTVRSRGEEEHSRSMITRGNLYVRECLRYASFLLSPDILPRNHRSRQQRANIVVSPAFLPFGGTPSEDHLQKFLILPTFRCTRFQHGLCSQLRGMIYGVARISSRLRA